MDIVSKSLNSLEYDKVLNELAKFAKIPQSLDLCLNLLPFENKEKIISEILFTREAKRILDLPSDIPIEFVADVASIQRNALTSYLTEQELFDIAKTMRTSRLVKNFISDNCEPESKLKGLSESLISFKELEDRIFDTFDSDLQIKKDATPQLKGLFASLRETEKALKNKVSDLLNSSEFTKHLQELIYTTRDERIVFQVKASSKNKVKGIVHDVSATNKTFYIEPECLVSINNKIREVQSQIHAEFVRILAELTQAVKLELKSIKYSEEILARIDFHFAKARYAVRTHSCEPEIISSKEIVFENMRHPLLIGHVENIVANNFEIGKDYKSIIITGSNTGGKTVTLKTIGLFILLAKSGMFLPCTMAKVYPFKNVFADIGDAQSIQQSLSTFSSHMTNIIDIINGSNGESFVLLDEICAGTDPQEGAVLAQVILENLAAKGVYSTVTTHYGELKALEYSNPYFKNASVEFDTTSLKPTYKLLIGIPGLSNAISISANLGLPHEITDKAKQILTSEKDNSIVVVEKLQETQQKLSENLKEAEVLKEDSELIKKEYEENLSAVKKEKNKTIKNIKEKFNREMLEVKAEIKDILEELRKEKSEKIARRSYARLAKLEQNFHGKVSDHEDKEHYAEIDWNEVKINDKLILKDIHNVVEVLTLPDKHGNLLVQMGNIKTKIKKAKLAPYDKSFEKKNYGYTPSKFETFEFKRTNLSNRLDIRGYRVEDALDELELYLDKASLANLTPVTIIHGHGTGALKSSVRDFLSTSPYVAKFRPGEDSEGGDGVSVVDIN